MRSLRRLNVNAPVLAAVLFCALVAGGSHALGAKLEPDTLKAWEEYQRLTEQRIASELESSQGFLVQDFLPPEDQARCRRALEQGEVYITEEMDSLTVEGGKFKVPHGLIHHWLGAIYLPDVKLADLLVWLQDYDQHENFFAEVQRSRVLSRDGDVFEIFLKLKRKKIITVHYNTEHRVEYRHHGIDRVSSASYATRIAELKNAGTPKEREKPKDKDRGFLWRLNSYWRFQQKDGGVVVECESISLSRSIPVLVPGPIKRFVKDVAKESLENTLVSIRDGFRKPEDPVR